MEKLFVRILNFTLLAAGFVTLLAAIVLVAGAAFELQSSLAPNSEPSSVTVEYQPLSQVSATVTPTSPTAATVPDTPLKQAANDFCSAEDAFVKAVTESQYSMKDRAKCVSGATDLANSAASDRSENFLEEGAKYFQAVTADPQRNNQFSVTDDKEKVGTYLQQVAEAFSDKFKAAAASDDTRRAQSDANATAAKGLSVLLGTAAASTFISFLFIAFLIVAIRMEKHLGRIEDKLPSAARP